MVEQGATTIWERWDGWTASGASNPLMNSFNHYTLGAVGEWLYRFVLGIEPDTDGAGFSRAHHAAASRRVADLGPKVWGPVSARAHHQ